MITKRMFSLTIIGLNNSKLETIYSTIPVLKTILEDKLVNMIRDLHFRNRSQSINVDFSCLFHNILGK